MDGGQILQIVLSLAVVGFALYLSARVARRRFGSVAEPTMKVVSRQSVSRTQNLVVVEVGGNRHLIAFTDGGATAVDVWDAPEPEASHLGEARYVQKTPLAKSWVPGLDIAEKGGTFAKLLKQKTAGTQWSGLGKQPDFAAALAATKPETPKWPQRKISARPSADQLAARTAVPEVEAK
ncbi:flagellar biosynthetic protein FliO (plasmid) [Citricoccus nitrophenolicus]